MSAQFDSHADSYREEVNRAISFVGKDVDFFAGRKARLLQAAARRLIGDPAELSILDVGCGIGLVDRYLSSAFRSVAGVDVSPAELAIASAQHPQVSYTLSHAGRLPYDPGSFDVAFAACVLHHVDEDDHASFGAEIGRVVRPGGLVVIDSPNPASFYVYAHAFYLDPTHTRPTHPLFLMFLFERAGFEKVELEWRSPPPDAALLEPVPGDDALAHAVNENIARLNAVLYGPQDFAIIARR